jgi:hypothetical protein
LSDGETHRTFSNEGCWVSLALNPPYTPDAWLMRSLLGGATLEQALAGGASEQEAPEDHDDPHHQCDRDCGNQERLLRHRHPGEAACAGPLDRSFLG